jgi:hypothetical protein
VEVVTITKRARTSVPNEREKKKKKKKKTTTTTTATHHPQKQNKNLTNKQDHKPKATCNDI